MKSISCLRRTAIAAASLCCSLWSQSPDRTGQILDRLERLEKQNAALMDEIRALRKELEEHPPAATEAQERLDIQERRTEELAQTKVESSQKYPIRLAGMALFNTYLATQGQGVVAEVAPRGYTDRTGGATLAQSIFGLDFFGPSALLGGKVKGSVRFQLYNYADLYTDQYSPFESPALRLRTATIDIDWKSRSLTVGQEKPLVSTRNPDSLAQVGIPPLSGAGNLWYWQPQVRFEQRFATADHRDSFRAQGSVLMTNENGAYVSGPSASTLEPRRPAYQGRFEWTHSFGDEAFVAVAPLFHWSATHVAGTSVNSQLAGFDASVRPGRVLELTGTYFAGQNIANLGALGQGFTIHPSGAVTPAHSRGGWGQVSILPASRLSFHAFAGVQADRESDLYGGISRNLSYAVNAFYRVAPNVIFSVEAGQIRTRYIGSGERLRNNYDAALAYLF